MPGGLLCNASKLLPDVGAAVDVAVADAISKVTAACSLVTGLPIPSWHTLLPALSGHSVSLALFFNNVAWVSLLFLFYFAVFFPLLMTKRFSPLCHIMPASQIKTRCARRKKKAAAKIVKQQPNTPRMPEGNSRLKVCRQRWKRSHRRIVAPAEQIYKCTCKAKTREVETPDGAKRYVYLQTNLLRLNRHLKAPEN